MAFQECLLGLGWINPVDGLARVGEPEDEHVALRFHAVQHDPDFTEVHFGLSAGGMFLRDECLHTAASLHIDLGPADSHVVTHRRIRQLIRTMFVDQPGQDPAGSMALLPRRRRVLDEHRVDRRFEWIETW